MATLHTFGCSITQGHALPDVVTPMINPQTGVAYTDEEIRTQNIQIDWEQIHVLAPSKYAWPQVLADQLNMDLVNHARRGACWHQIARQVAKARKAITPEDTVIVMWTYLSRLSLQWPNRTAVPYCNIADPNWNWRTIILGFNQFFGLSRANHNTNERDTELQRWIHTSTEQVFLDSKHMWDRYYNSLVLQTHVDLALRSTGARVLHLSVESEPAHIQLEMLRQELAEDLREYTAIPNHQDINDVHVDHTCTEIILHPDIPLAENDMHPSVEHHQLFATYIRDRYFRESAKRQR